MTRRDPSGNDAGFAGGTTVLRSVIECPHCGHRREETMPDNACIYFYECRACKKTLRPRPGECCVFCSFGTVACPPVQCERPRQDP